MCREEDRRTATLQGAVDVVIPSMAMAFEDFRWLRDIQRSERMYYSVHWNENTLHLNMRLGDSAKHS